MRLGTKISIYLTLVLVIILSIYALDMLNKRRLNMIHQMKGETLTVGTAMSIPLEEALRDSEFARVQRLLDASEQIGEIYGLYVADARGNVRMRTSGARDIVDGRLINEVLIHNRTEDEYLALDEMPVYVLYIPLYLSEQELSGVLVVARSLGALQVELEDLQRSTLAAVLILLALLLFGTVFLIRQSVTAPVNMLVHAVSVIGGGNFRYRTPIRRGTGREIVDLSVAIESMGMRLEEEQRQLQEETAKRVELEARLRQADKLATLGQVAAGLAHEIGTPLNIIGGRADMAIQRIDDRERVLEHLQIMRNQVDRIADTVSRLLNVARRQDRRRGPAALQDILADSVKLLDPSARKAGVYLRFYAETRGEVVGDEELLQQVFTNLMVNAIQSSPAGKRVDVTLRPVTTAPAGVDHLTRPYLEVSVCDQGKGVPVEARKRVFEPFFTTKPPGEGTGLGLAICAGIVKEHEGFIRVGDNPGGGACFSVYLPAESDPSVEGIYT